MLANGLQEYGCFPTNSATCPAPDTPKNDDPPPPCAGLGNPINPATGDKYQKEADYQGTGGLSFIRHYHSSATVASGNIGSHWRHNFENVIYSDGSTVVRVMRATGRQVVYKPTGSGWASDPDINDRLVRRTDANGAFIGWRLTTEDDTEETYDASGKLTNIKARGGYTQTLNYTPAPTTAGLPMAGLLDTVTDTEKRTLKFNYDNQSRVSTVTLLDAAEQATDIVYTYGYDDATDNLTSVTYPRTAATGNPKRTYLYNEHVAPNDFTQGTDLPHALTGIKDERGIRYATFRYQTDGKAIATEHAGGVDKYQLSYGYQLMFGSPRTDLPETTFSTPLDNNTYAYTRHFATVQGMIKSTGQNQPEGKGGTCLAASNQIEYDGNGNVTKRTDFNGNLTCYAYDTARNLETVRVEGVLSGACPDDLAAYTPAPNTTERKITTQWHGFWRVPTKKAEPQRITEWVWGNLYSTGTDDKCGAHGTLCRQTVYTTNDRQGTLGLSAVKGSGRLTLYGYNNLGKLTSVNGPRGDTTDMTRYAYYAPNDTTLNNRNQLQSVSHTVYDAANLVTGSTLTTTYGDYDGQGHPQTITAPNGVATTLTYTPRGQVETVTTNSSTTTFTYYPNTLPDSVTSPATGKTSYGYDAAQRLNGITNGNSESVAYTLNKAGERTQELYKTGGATPTTTQTVNRQFDNFGRLWQELNAANEAVYEHHYDPQGNLARTIAHPDATPAHDQTTDYATFNSSQRLGGYDALNRLIALTDADNGLTTTGYDGLDRTASVTDPRGNATTFVTNGHGDQLQEDSPDRGQTNNTAYDAAGNLKTSVDALGNTATLTYDSLGRPLTATYTGAPGILSASHTYVYDKDTDGKGSQGQLVKITDPSGNTRWDYDLQGRLSSKTQTTYGVALTTQYAYDDALTIDTNNDKILDSSTGRLARLTYPSGLIAIYGYDAAGRVENIQLDTSNDGNDNPQPFIDQIRYYPWGGVKTWQLMGVQGQPTVVRYQNQDGRTTQYTWFNGAAERKHVTYDRLGNVTRLDEFVIGSTGNVTAILNPQDYSYDALNRLTDFTNIGLGLDHHYDYDAAGNRTQKQIGTASTVYQPEPDSNRLNTVSSTSTATYRYDATGNLKDNSSGAQFGYDARGRHTYFKANATSDGYFYRINALGQRTGKDSAAITTGGGARIFVYEGVGHLIGEYDKSGNRLQEHVWLGDLPVALIGGGGGVFPVLPDHLGTPRQIIDGSKQVRWQWDNVDPFGANPPDTNPSGLGGFYYPLRLPGQYFDVETGLFYNVFRSYDAKGGRYTQSDPIGIDGGLNTFGYVGGNPVNGVDPLGLVNVIPNRFDPDGFAGGGGGLGGGSAGGGLGGLGAAGIGLGGAMIADSLNDKIRRPKTHGWDDHMSTEDLIQKDKEWENYKGQCNGWSNPPPHLDLCAQKRWKIDQLEQCINMRKNWDAKWQYKGTADHPGEIARLEKTLRELIDNYQNSWSCRDQPLRCD
ncbi:RHS repeat-associated core domain-containing protein [Methylovulum miyakonense]|uniref:RHS repeat-associated core domain-containing protein n=1 Tax=Methylovulum miyakonense TaxID=645578 RepID=UPI0003802927|nr:RHS repeat-associated core domain-containing protein [Methylovulum miyakonense]